jgi:lycopene beta-cyclase
MSRQVNEPGRDFDCALVGGGLQNCLTALALWRRQPGMRIAIFEQAERLGGNHTWSCHGSDLPAGGLELLHPLVTARWAGYEVAFPSHRRTLSGDYFSIASTRLHQVVSERFAEHGGQLYFGSKVSSVHADAVELCDGRRFSARTVIEATGPAARPVRDGIGFQKFVGLELLLEGPHGRALPLLMDARVPQSDGMRFFYLLPFEPTRILIEDTYYSDDAELDVAAIEAQILGYAHDQGWQVQAIARREQGVLPLPLSPSLTPYRDGVLLSGYGAGFFHPTTGYSLPSALRFALEVAAHAGEPDFAARHARFLSWHARQSRFAALLTRLLFRAVQPGDRRHVLERFYRLPQDAIERFYALDTTALDRARILCGRPPQGLSLRAAWAARTEQVTP